MVERGVLEDMDVRDRAKTAEPTTSGQLRRALIVSLLLCAVVGGGLGARKAAARVVAGARPAAGPRAAAAPAIPEGAAITFACTQPTFNGPLELRCGYPYDPRYTQTLLQGFDRFTPSNEFKMPYLEPREYHFDFAVADRVAAFARANGKTIRGHTLVWGEMLPWWVAHPLLPWSGSGLASAMRQYISTVVGHFATAFPGTVTEWDVVNEPLAADGSLQRSVWLRAIGPDYIRMALDDAHAADPAAHLLINEISDESGAKAEAMLQLATQLKAAGAPLYAIGFESHVTPASAPTLDQLVSLWRRYAAVGLRVEVTELDVGNDRRGDDPAAKQAVFERYAQACRLARNCVGYTVWGVADRYSWLGPSSDALLYGPDFQPTPAAGIVRRILAGRLQRSRAHPGRTARDRQMPTRSRHSCSSAARRHCG
jgi:endo-1,4-beta-xylanase